MLHHRTVQIIGGVIVVFAALAIIGALTGRSSGDKAATPGQVVQAPKATATAPPPKATATSAVTGTAASTASSSTGVRCGVERWPVKTLSDQDAAKVGFAAVSSTTVAALRSLPAPSTLPDASRIAPTELTVFTVTARLVEAKLEEDRDFHVVIADPADPSATMIVEFPDAATCSGAVGSAHRRDMKRARQAFVDAFGTPPASHFAGLTGTGTITGVGFFDTPHGQRGVAPNAIELHPVLAFSVSSQPPATPPVGAAAGVTFTNVQGAPPGGMASVSVLTAPSASCTITYTTPAGTASSAQGLDPKTADSTGAVSWTWRISPRTRPGTGSVSVACGGTSARTDLTIS